MPVQPPEWRILTFGGLRILRLGQEMPRFETRKAASLFAMLALDLGKALSRDEIGERFWSGEYTDLQRSSLRQALSSIRRVLGDNDKGDGALVQADRISVRLNPAQCSCDHSEFLAFVRQPDNEPATRRAVELYTGPLLPEMASPDIVAERKRCQDAFISATIRLAELASTGDFDEAIGFLSRALSFDPTNAPAMLKKMTLLADAGRRSDALAEFQTYADNLRSELGVGTSEELSDLARKLRIDAGQRLVVLPTQATPPPFRSTVGPPLTPIFGREAELDRISNLTDPDSPQRVTAITGPGGIGKTRIALEIAWIQLDRFENGVWFIPLADVSHAAEIPARIIDALGIRHSPSDESDQIARHLQGRPALIILDNFEHLVETAVPAIKELLDRCPRLKILITSREGLNVGYDTELQISPLQTPSAMTLEPERLASVELFLDRARQAGSEIALNDHTWPFIVEICERLEGIPLSIVLAGARAQNRSVEQLVAALDRRLDFLATDRRDLPGRHQTLRASIDWSYRLLPDLQTFFAGLSVFRGGCTVEAAAEVCGEPDAEGVLEHLRRRSLVTQSANRFEMLETIREFAQDQLSAADCGPLRERHARYFGSLAELAHKEALGGKQEEWLATLSADEANLRASMDWGLSNDVDLALRTAAFLWFHWDVRGHVREAHRWLETAIDRADADSDPLALGRALHGLGVTHRNLGDVQRAREALARSIEIYEHAGEPTRMANPLNSLGVLEYRQGNTDAARPLLERCLRIFEELGDHRMIAMVRSNLGEVAVLEGDVGRAKSEISEALRLNRELGNLVWEAQNLELLGSVSLVTGDPESAREYYEQCKDLSNRIGKRSGTAFAIEGLAQLAMLSGRYSEALQMLKDAGRALYESGRASSVATVLLQASELAAHLGEGRLCARLMGASEHFGGPGVARSIVSVSAERNCVTKAVELVGREAADEERLFGSRLSLEESLQLLEDIHLVPSRS